MQGARDAAGEALLALDDVTRRLRRECPWDRAQDERSIVPHAVEEAYELAGAAHSGDDGKLADELGDVLFQVFFLALLLEERGAGALDQVARGVTEKLVRRHPHVFGNAAGGALSDLPTGAHTAAQVRENWDAIKRAEAGGEDPLDAGATLPALVSARKVQRRAAGGSDRVNPALAISALRERLEEAAEAISSEGAHAQAQEETRHGSELLYRRLGDLLFAVVDLSRAVQVDPEVALSLAVGRFGRDGARAPAAGGEKERP